MRMLLTLSLALLTGWTLSAQDKKADFDLKKMEGSWSFSSGSKAGTKSDDPIKKYEVTVKGTELTLNLAETGKFIMKVTLVDGKKSPAHVDFEITEGPIGKGSVAKGIVSVDGDEMKICYPNMGEGDRPAKFDGEKNYCFILKKKK
ncbi:MAG: TIGR03067 domain-containing protein [Gemmataceae bacterium]